MAQEAENTYLGGLLLGDDGVTAQVIGVSPAFDESTFQKTGTGLYQIQFVDGAKPNPFVAIALCQAATLGVTGSPNGIARANITANVPNPGDVTLFMQCNDADGNAANAIQFSVGVFRLRTDQ